MQRTVNNQFVNAVNKAARYNMIANAAHKIAQRNAHCETETIECLRTEEVSDCFHFVAERVSDID